MPRQSKPADFPKPAERMGHGGLVLGIDPDMHSTAWALLEEDGRIKDCGVCRQSEKFKGHEAIRGMAFLLRERINGPTWDGFEIVSVIETQQYRDKGSDIPVAALLNLALVSGMAVAECARIGAIHLADPTVWTKGWKKEVRHNRLRELTYGMTDEELARKFCFNRGDAKHVWDAIGLALWWLKDIN